MRFTLSIFIVLIALAQGALLADNQRVELAVWPSTDTQETPDIYGNIVVWSQYVSEFGDYDVFAADINNPGGELLFNTDTESDQINPTVYENYIVWQDYVSWQQGADWDIRLADISDSNEPSIFAITNYLDNNEQNPAIHGNIIVWEDGFEGNMNIFGADITEPSNPREFLVTGLNVDQRKPAIFRNTVIWQDFYANKWDIYVADIWLQNKPAEFPVSLIEYDQENPAISGNMVVWAENFNGDWDIYAAEIFDLEHLPSGMAKSTVETAISINNWDETNPDIDENIIVWQDNRNGNWDIFGYNVTTGTEFLITDNNYDQTNPAISGKIVVWQDNRNGNTEIFAAFLSDIEAAKCTQKLAGDINGDCKVDFEDYTIMASQWLEFNLTPPELCQ